MEVKLISKTQISNELKAELPPKLHSAEGIMAYCARVSSEKQDNPDYAKLLLYCWRNGHWSVFEQADMSIEITTSRAIAQQILRHRSFTFQEFSQRYAKAVEFEEYDARRQDSKNRQNSIDDMSIEAKEWFQGAQNQVVKLSKSLYEVALEKGIAKEQARFLLPLSTQTKLYMKGSVRSWIHYLSQRCDKATQKEHREIAQAIFKIFKKEFPLIGGLI